MTTYSMIVLGILCPVVLIVVIFIVKYIMWKRAIDQMRLDVEDWIAEYKRKMTGNNRFVIDLNILQEAFPEYSQAIVRQVWREMVASNVVQEDPMDKALIIRP